MTDVIYTHPVNEGCSELTRFFAGVGGSFLIAIIYMLLFLLVREVYLAVKQKKLSEMTRDEKDNANLYAGFWIVTVPLTLVVGVGYWIGKWIILPFIAATKRDVRDAVQESEKRITKRIILNTTPVKNQKPLTKFVPGDLITGIKGNPDNYNHLNEGSVSKVISIDEKDSMKVVLIDHKDFLKHKDVIGKVFKAPSRNFVKYSQGSRKKKR